MARYGRDLERHRMGMHDFSERGGGGGDRPFDFGGRGDYRGGYGGRGGAAQNAGMIGGMRSDAGPTRWDRFPGEEGWLGQGYAGYPGGDVRGGGRGFGGGFRSGGGGYGGDFRPDFAGSDLGVSDLGMSDRPRGGFGSGNDANRVRARDIMTDNPECLTPDATVADAATRMRDLNVGILPVVDSLDNRRLKGVITDRDLAIRVLADGKDGKAKVADYMTEQLGTVNQNDTIRAVISTMKREQVRRVPVTDREGRLVGIIAQADLAVDYAGLDLDRETEVEEVVERISEPARPRR